VLSDFQKSRNKVGSRTSKATIRILYGNNRKVEDEKIV
jgi:hypothetical protein